MADTTPDPRQTRRLSEELNEFQRAEGHPQFRVDVERIRFSPFYSRLSAVTQVISQAGAGLAVHNRLTHSVKVAAVARAIATHLSTRTDEARRIVDELGGAHPVVVQAAAAAHDLGHPPFGHLGEQTLDRLARTRFGLREGFEGNAQTYRIMTRLDEHDKPGVGLNLTAAVRAAVLKYPWLRGRGGARRGGASKFNFYAIDMHDVRTALAPYPRIEEGQQTVECSIMDVSDDIAYSLHDLDDFYRAGLLNPASIAAEFRTWHRELAALRSLDDARLGADTRAPGHSLRAALAAARAQGPLDRGSRRLRAVRRQGRIRRRRRPHLRALRRVARERALPGALHRRADRPPGVLDRGPPRPRRALRSREPRSRGVARRRRAQVPPPALHPGAARPRGVPARAGERSSSDSSTGSPPGSTIHATPAAPRDG